MERKKVKHQVRIRDVSKTRAEDDGNSGEDVGEWATNDCREACSKIRLQQCVNPCNKEQCLDYSGLLFLQENQPWKFQITNANDKQHNAIRGWKEREKYIAAAHLGDEEGRNEDGGAKHNQIVLECKKDGLRWEGEEEGC